MKTDFLICDMRFEDLDINDVEGCRRRVSSFIEEPGFETALQDLGVTAKAVDDGPAPRGEGNCSVGVHGGSGGWGGSISCGVRF